MTPGFRMKLTTEEERVLLALSELEPASLERVAKETGVGVQRLRGIFKSLARKGLLQHSVEPSDKRVGS
jgi:DNA-binding MarR family transcriptional regulator